LNKENESGSRDSGAVLALDVALKNLGWCVFDVDGQIVDCGTVQVKPGAGPKYVQLEAAARELAAQLLLLVGKYKPEEVVAEMPLEGSKSMNAVQAMRLAAGVVVGTCAGAGLTLHTTRPRDGKIALCGSPKAEKDDMMASARSRWPSAPWPSAKCRMEHAADAAAAYIAR
jgi:Holliday junction resolvasome RuvABC endonuclease subunit